MARDENTIKKIEEKGTLKAEDKLKISKLKDRINANSENQTSLKNGKRKGELVL